MIASQEEITISFSRNMPDNMTEIVDFIDKLRTLLPDETLISKIPFIENPALEIEKREEELRGKLSIDDYEVDELIEDEE